MIAIETKLSGNLPAALDKYEQRIKQQALLSGVAKAARVIYDEVLINVARGGPHFPDVQEGVLQANIYRAYAPEASTDAQKVYVVGPRKGKVRHWFFLEYGTSTRAAQPYLRPAAAHLPRALDAGTARMTERLKELK